MGILDRYGVPAVQEVLTVEEEKPRSSSATTGSIMPTTERACLRYGRNVQPHGTHEIVLKLVPPESRVLDVGCATGYLGRVLSERGSRVWGLDRDAEAVGKARSDYEDVCVLDLDEAERLPWPEGFFDVIIAADVLEHLRDPDEVLSMLARYMRPGGKALVSLPNIAHLSVRLPLLVGRFRYRDTGILDRTHLHLFTHETARSLVERSGFRVDRLLSGSDRFGSFLNRYLLLGRLLRGALAYSIIVVGTSREDADE